MNNFINYPYGNSLINATDRNYPTSATFGQDSPINDKYLMRNTNLAPSLVQSKYRPNLNQIAQENTDNVNMTNSYFLKQGGIPGILGASEVSGVPGSEHFTSNFANIDLQSERPKGDKNRFIDLASNTLHAYPDALLSIFFSDSNINHLRRVIVQKVKEYTTFTILEPKNSFRFNITD